MQELLSEKCRICPNCHQVVYHSSKMCADNAKKANRQCWECKNKKFKIDFLGDKNPFFGKRHTENTKEIIREKKTGKKQSGSQLERSRETIAAASKIARLNGKNNYERWIKKYGKDEADRLLAAFKSKLSEKNSGKGNPMHGKPPPSGSGNGWANWYNGIHFRSLRELTYYITEIENKGLTCRIAETKDLMIPYTDPCGVERTYTADFLVEEKYLIEVKPKRLWNTPKILLKRMAGEKFCEQFGYIYTIVDIEPNSSLIKDKYLNGEVKFVEKYIEKFKKYAGIE